MQAQSFSPTAIPAIRTAEAPTPKGIAVRRNVIYGKGGTRDLHADIAYPKSAPAPLPAVIFIHGGGWKEGTRKESPILYLAQAGYFAASIDYRLTDEARWPAQIQDCKLAVRRLRANAAEYGIGFPILPQARSDDGLLDICALPCKSRGEMLTLLLKAAAGEHLEVEGAQYRRGVRITVSSDEPVPVQVDGEAGGFTPLEVELLPTKVPFIVP